MEIEADEAAGVCGHAEPCFKIVSKLEATKLKQAKLAKPAETRLHYLKVYLLLNLLTC